jgi:hypothetical protein
MIVLFRNIPKDTYYNDIETMVQPVIKGGLLSQKGNLSRIEILALQESDNKPLEFQAIAHIEPEAAAMRVIKKLHGMYVKGCRIMVREYFIRSWRNDKRNQEGDAVSPLLIERRTTPCRRRKLKIFKIALPEYR